MDKPSTATPEVSAALGELYEYDQEFDAARKQYNKAIEMIDQRVSDLLGYKTKNGSGKDFYGFITILKNLEKKPWEAQFVDISLVIDWAIFRLRLMLKIAMTFEVTRNYERAQSTYHETHALSLRLLQFIVEENNVITRPWLKKQGGPTFYNAKHFNVLFQAVFAKAWLAEKNGARVDTSYAIIKADLNYFEHMLKSFSLQKEVKDYFGSGHYNESKSGELVHSSFGLIKSDFYNKAGDLCFYKGASSDMSALDGSSPAFVPANKHELHKHGYLYRASRFYATSLHYLRYFNLCFIEYSKTIFSESDNEQPTFSPEHLSLHLLLACAGTFADLAEALLARIDVTELIRRLETGIIKVDLQAVLISHNIKATTTTKIFKTRLKNFTTTAQLTFDKWLKYNDEKNKGSGLSYADILKKIKSPQYYRLWCNNNNFDLDEFLAAWLGTRNKAPLDKYNDDVLLSGQTTGCPIERLLCYFAMINLTIKYLTQAGHLEEAAYEARKVVNSINTVLTLFILAKRHGPTCFDEEKDKHGKIINPIYKFNSISLISFITFIIENGVYYCGKSKQLYLQHYIHKGNHKNSDKITDGWSKKLVHATLSFVINTIQLSLSWGGKADFINALQSTNIHWDGNQLATHKADLPAMIKNIVEQEWLDTQVKSDLQTQSQREEVIAQVKALFSGKHKVQATQTLNEQSIAWLGMFEQLLQHLCRSQRYPVLNRLKMLRQLSLLITERPQPIADLDLDNAIAATKELLEIEEQYNAPYHFPPSRVAYTCFQLAYVLSEHVKEIKLMTKKPFMSLLFNDLLKQRQADIDYFYTRAAIFLAKSREMSTGNSYYYQSINDLYYLYDDFNDRSMHHSKAVQILSLNILGNLEKYVKDQLIERPWLPEPSSTEDPTNPF